MVKAVKSLNPYKDGTCRTIKSQYYKNSLANFVRRGVRCNRSYKEI